MPAPSTFDYAVVRVMPRVERGELINVGVIVFCRTQDFLAARVALDRPRLVALWPEADADEIERGLAGLVAVCEGRPEAGPIALLPAPERFQWLVAPSSTVIQLSPVHCGLDESPARALAQLFERLVKAPVQGA